MKELQEKVKIGSLISGDTFTSFANIYSVPQVEEALQEIIPDDKIFVIKNGHSLMLMDKDDTVRKLI